MRILVTGGAGFIGYHLCRSLLTRGDVENVIIVDSYLPYYDPGLKKQRMASFQGEKRLSFYEQDILDEAGMRMIMEREKPDAIIHLAAIPGVRGSLETPLTYVDIDVKGTVQMLELARSYGACKFIFASSSSVYGEKPMVQPFGEDDVNFKVASPYAASKLSAEIFCRTYADIHGLAVTALRFFTVYGPHQRPDMAISKFAKHMLNNEPFTLFDVTSVRDYTYVDDIVRGLEAALERMQGWQVYNLGSSQPVGLLELVKVLERITGREAAFTILGKQLGDVSGTWADISRAKQCLGWEPMIPLSEGLERYCQWLAST